MWAFYGRGNPAMESAFSDSFRSSCRLDGGVDFLAVAHDNRIELLLDLTQYPWRIHSWEIPFNMLVNNLDQRKKFSH